ncbi:PASTA domain-containing protein [Cytophagaceae bacterium 50C-KIRBA]|uniref:PASTA domain-containing protein n=1 Tax=Aquirufa beregesia TaxID=2516556 RepID=A0ABX0EXF2_9BACT|nr:penicillin-binding protein [Aquirufa beregesia]NGZ44167.1 PASTA domain-containing protein [Aquirufa beregesia]
MAKAKRQNIREIITKRFIAFFIVVILLFVVLVFNLYKIVFINGDTLRNDVFNTYIKERSVDATRGNIYSDDGSLLATSLPKYRLGLDPSVYNRNATSEQKFKEHIDELANALADFFQDHTAEEYKNKIVSAKKNGKNYLLLNNRLLDFQERKKVAKFPLFNLGEATKTGIVFDKVNVRYAPFGQMAYRTVGYLKDKVAVGVEGSFNAELKGTPGKGLFEKMDKNTWRPVEGGEESVPKPGLDIYTTLDINIQDIVESALMKAMTTYEGDYGVVIVMESATGEIKAISNLSKNANSPTGYSESFNYAIREARDPGSVFKLPSMMAMLEEADLPLDMPVSTGNGKYHHYNGTMSDSHPMGTISVAQVIESSSNVGTMVLMKKVFASKPAKFYDYLKKYHLIESLHFQIQPNPRPNFPVPAKWDAFQLLWSSVGYSTQYSPLQMISFYNAIANNGYWVQPIIVSKATRADEVVIDYRASQIRDQAPLCSPKTLEKIQSMLEGVVTKGTANNIKGTSYGIAGKTGTAQRIINGRYIPGKYYTSFIGYFPVKKPKYTILVSIDNPQGHAEATYARQVTAPVFREISDNIYLRDMKLHRKLAGTLPDSLNKASLSHTVHPMDQSILYSNFGLPKVEEDGSWLQFKMDKQMVQNTPLSFPAKTVPNVVGMNLRDAIFTLENRGLKVKANGLGTVVSQSVPAGSPTRKNLLLQIQLQ